MATVQQKVPAKKFPISLTASVSKVTEMKEKRGKGIIPMSQSLNTHFYSAREGQELGPLPRNRGESLSTTLFTQRRRSMRRPTMTHELHGEIVTQSRKHTILTRAGSSIAESENSEKDKRNRTNLVRNLRKQHSKQLYEKFKLVAKMAIFCIKMTKSHNIRNKLYDEIAPYLNSLHFYDYGTPVEGIELMFDPSIYKADKQLRMSDEAIKILNKPPSERTDKELYYVQLCLRNIKCFAEYPMRMQRKIVEVGQYEKYEAKRVIVRQGKPACAFYFILSGSVVVMVYENNTKVAKPVAYMSKGMPFGELAIINRTDRQASIVARTTLELLSIDIEDFHRIFMAGGVKNINDPDHDDFVRSLWFLKGWPLKGLAEQPTKCIFHYFKRGDILVQDSNYSDWLYVVKSGSMQVLKKLKRVEPYEGKRKAKQAFVKVKSDKEKRDERDIQLKQRRFILPAIKIPKRSASEIENSDKETVIQSHSSKEIDEVSAANSHSSLETSKLRNNGVDSTGNMSYIDSRSDSSKEGWTPDQEGDSNRSSISTIEIPEVLVNGSKIREADMRRLSVNSLRGPHVQKRRGQKKTKKKERKSKDDEEFEADIQRKQHIRTINDDFDSKYKLKSTEELTEADIDPQFVHIQTLTKGQVFGLPQLILGQQPSFCVVSGGVEVIMIDKSYYLQQAPDDLVRRIRQESCPYPTDEEMQENLQIAIDWTAYKASTFKDTLRYLETKKSPRDSPF